MKKLLCMALLAAIASSDGTPKLSLASNQALKRQLRKHCGPSGFLMNRDINPADISCLKTVLQSFQCNIFFQDNHFELIIDSGCLNIFSPNLKIFIPVSLKNLPIPLAMEGIASQFLSKQKGTILYEVINDQGGISVLQCEGYYLPDLKIRLFSPQTFLQEHKTGRYSLEWDKSIFELPNGDRINIVYRRQTSTPIL